MSEVTNYHLALVSRNVNDHDVRTSPASLIKTNGTILGGLYYTGFFLFHSLRALVLVGLTSVLRLEQSSPTITLLHATLATRHSPLANHTALPPTSVYRTPGAAVFAWNPPMDACGADLRQSRREGQDRSRAG